MGLTVSKPAYDSKKTNEQLDTAHAMSFEKWQLKLAEAKSARASGHSVAESGDALSMLANPSTEPSQIPGLNKLEQIPEDAQDEPEAKDK